MRHDCGMEIAVSIPCYVRAEAASPVSRSGAWISTHECCAALARAGHNVTAVATLDRGQPYEIDGVKVVPGLGGLTWEDVAPNAEVVISHLGAKDGAAERAIKAGRPSVRFAHGLTTEWVDCVGDLVVWNSEALRAEAGERCSEVPEDLVLAPPIFPDRYRVEPGTRVTLGNLSTAKGAGVFWHLALRLRNRRFLGVMASYRRSVGPGGSRIRSPRDVRQKNVAIVPPTEPREIYAHTRVLLMPSEKEAYGRMAMEAACSGIPAICHPTPGLVESMGDGATFVDRDDMEGWVREVERLMSDPDAWAEASARAFARSESLDPVGDLDRFVAVVEGLVR